MNGYADPDRCAFQAFLQMIILLGFAGAACYSRLRGGLLEWLIYWLPLSLTINHLAIFLLTALRSTAAAGFPAHCVGAGAVDVSGERSVAAFLREDG